MGALIAVVVAATCFAPNDASPGWKQVALPDDARALAAPEGVAQFRSDEWVTVVDERSELYLAGAESFGGRTSFEFTLGEGGKSLEVHFERPLRGAKVDVTAWGPMGAMTLMNEQRVGGASLTLSWGANEARVVTVRVHEHLRERPVVRAYRSIRQVPAAAMAQDAPAFRLPRSLYYLQPVGAPVTLCDEPSRALTVPAGALTPKALPTPVSLRRLEARRPRSPVDDGPEASHALVFFR